MRRFPQARRFLVPGSLAAGLMAAIVPASAADQFMLVNVQTQKCLTIAGGTSTANNVTALQYDCDSHPSRRWWLSRMGSAYQIRNVQTGKCLTIAGGVSTDNNVIALQYNCDDHPSRRWRITDVGGVYRIRNVQTGKCLTIAGGTSTANNVDALQYDCDSHPSRTWRVRRRSAPQPDTVFD